MPSFDRQPRACAPPPCPSQSPHPFPLPQSITIIKRRVGAAHASPGPHLARRLGAHTGHGHLVLDLQDGRGVEVRGEHGAGLDGGVGGGLPVGEGLQGVGDWGRFVCSVRSHFGRMAHRQACRQRQGTFPTHAPAFALTLRLAASSPSCWGGPARTWAMAARLASESSCSLSCTVSTTCTTPGPSHAACSHRRGRDEEGWVQGPGCVREGSRVWGSGMCDMPGGRGGESSACMGGGRPLVSACSTHLMEPAASFPTPAQRSQAACRASKGRVRGRVCRRRGRLQQCSPVLGAALHLREEASESACLAVHAAAAKGSAGARPLLPGLFALALPPAGRGPTCSTDCRSSADSTEKSWSLQTLIREGVHALAALSPEEDVSLACWSTVVDRTTGTYSTVFLLRI